MDHLAYYSTILEWNNLLQKDFLYLKLLFENGNSLFITSSAFESEFFLETRKLLEALNSLPTKARI